MKIEFEKPILNKRAIEGRSTEQIPRKTHEYISFNHRQHADHAMSNSAPISPHFERFFGLKPIQVPRFYDSSCIIRQQG